LRRYERILVEIVIFERGWVTVGVRKLASLGYHVALFAFSRFDTIPAGNRQDTHDDGLYPCIASTARGAGRNFINTLRIDYV